jgi:hypothetical protein
VVLILFAQIASSATFTFTDKHIYTSYEGSRIINEYDESGNWRSSIDMGSDNSLTMIKGMSFGQDNLLYASVKDTNDTTKVVAFNALGQIQATYVHPMNISGHVSYGNILTTNNNIFVAHGFGIAKMTIGDESSATDIISKDSCHDFALLASGNIVVATSYDVFEYTQEGVLVAQYLENDDNNVMSSFYGYRDIRGIAVDESKGVYYVSMLGSHQLLKMNLNTHSIMDNVYVKYGDEIQILNNGNIVVGSDAQAPEIYTSDLSLVATLGSDPQTFVTQLGGYVPPALKPKNVISSYLFLLLK